MSNRSVTAGIVHGFRGVSLAGLLLLAACPSIETTVTLPSGIVCHGPITMTGTATAAANPPAVSR